MGQSHSYEEFMPEKDIPNSFDGLEQSRIEWEKKIGFLFLLEIFGIFGFFGSAEYQNFDDKKITRTDIKKYLESFNISNYIDWIEQTMPNKIIKIVSKDIDFLQFEIQKQIETDPEYINLINPLKYKLMVEKYNTLTPDDKIIIYSEITKSYNKIYSGDLMIVKLYMKLFFSKYGETEKKIIEFFDCFNTYGKNRVLKFIDELFKRNKTNNNSIFNIFSTQNSNLWKKKLEFIKNINYDSEFHESSHFFTLINLSVSNILNKLDEIASIDDKIKFVDEYFLNAERDKMCEMCDYYNFKDMFGDVKKNKELKTLIENTKYEIFRTKYYDKLDEETKSKYTKYRLDFNSHWELFKLDEEKYMEIITDNALIDDYTFEHYNFDNFCFLNGFNDEVQTYLKNKIQADTNYIVDESRHTKISNLDNFIDIMYFIHNPPSFLRPKDYKFCPDYIELANKYLEELGYDFSKINYLNMKPQIVFEYS